MMAAFQHPVDYLKAQGLNFSESDEALLRKHFDEALAKIELWFINGEGEGYPAGFLKSFVATEPTRDRQTP